MVTTPNEYLAGYARRYSSVVEVVPMALDLSDWQSRSRQSSEFITIGWAGAPVNGLLERLDADLSVLLDRHPSVRLAVFSEKKPNLKCPFDYYPFRPGAEPEFVSALDIGLLPLADEEYTRGKSPIKALQYLACSVPVVGNVYGATAEIVSEQTGIAVNSEVGWLPALEQLIHDMERVRILGRHGRQLVESCYDIEKVGSRFCDLLLGSS